MVNDVIALSSGGEGARVTFGCATNETQEIYTQQADGVFGLGNGTSSVISQARPRGWRWRARAPACWKQYVCVGRRMLSMLCRLALTLCQHRPTPHALAVWGPF